MEDLTSCDWDQSIAAIDDVLTNASLTPEQSESMSALRETLLSRVGADGDCAAAKRERASLIPRLILERANTVTVARVEDTGSNRTKRASLIPASILERATSAPADSRHLRQLSSECAEYLAGEFGGVRVNSDRARLMWKKVVHASAFVGFAASQVQEHAAQLLLRSSSESENLYAPPEWTELTPESKYRLRQQLSWKSLSRWGFNALDLADSCGGKTALVLVGWAILGSPHSQAVMASSICNGEKEALDESASDKGTDSGPTKTTASASEGYDFVSRFDVSPETLCNFLRAIEADYKSENPYHNNVHAADVLQTTHSLIQMGGMAFAGDGDADSDTTALELFSLFLAAAIHDVGHPGTNNAFQIRSRSEEAVTYNDASVLENNSIALAFRLLLGSGRRPELDVFSGLKLDQVDTVRSEVIFFVLGTDMAHHFAHTGQIKGRRASIGSSDPKSFLDQDSGEPASTVLRFILHLADISNPAKPKPLFIEWADRCLEEFFAQGDTEKIMGLPTSPLCDRQTTDRAESQIGFIQFIVMPSFELLGELLPTVKDEILPGIYANLAYWEKLNADSEPVVEESAEPEPVVEESAPTEPSSSHRTNSISLY